MTADLPTMLQKRTGPAPPLRGKEIMTPFLPPGKLRQRSEWPRPWSPSDDWTEHPSLRLSGIETEVTVELVFNSERI